MLCSRSIDFSPISIKVGDKTVNAKCIRCIVCLCKNGDEIELSDVPDEEGAGDLSKMINSGLGDEFIKK